ncbi:transglutaminase [Acuticoccus sediminis]|uniref:Transglutaminase n=1 Tax=Acuticoccus sediminis TaxID=2184697 RepID=A0A8B2NJU3_9HYPH|nr:transglutaminase family protein [Acuticoccus sediminis]RAH97641.1 transglutaminase [Acuticoccus sediminis]
MRLSICHETDYRYEQAPNSVIELLRLTPASTATQTVRSWRIDVSGDAVLRRSEDAFGNLVHTFSVSSPGESLTITATGTVDTEPTNGVVTGTPERLPVGVFLRHTPLTEPDDAIRDLAAAARAKSSDTPLDRAHALNTMVFETMRYETGRTGVATTAAAALEAGHGVCQDLAHILIAAARADGLPARYISGYQYVEGRPRTSHEAHAWTEIHLPDLGWIAFDPTMGLCGTDHYVRVAVGLDTMSASPLRGAIYGGLGEVLDVTVTVDCAPGGPGGRQRQSQGGQSQSMD